MKRDTLLLKAGVLLFGLFIFFLCVVVVPMGIATDNTEYYRPILFGLYLPAIPFFIAIYNALKLLGMIDKGKAFSPESVAAFKNVKLCGFAIAGLFALGMPYIYYVAELDDAPGAILVGLVIILISFTVATAAAVFQRLVQAAVDIKSENDLTV